MASSNGKVSDVVWIHNFAALIFPHVSGNGSMLYPFVLSEL